MVSCVRLAFGAEKSKVQSLGALQAKFDGVARQFMKGRRPEELWSIQKH